MDSRPPARLPALKLIWFALMMSTLTFTAVAAGLVISGSAPAPANTLLFAVLVPAMGVMILPAALLFGSLFAVAARQQWPKNREHGRAGDWLMNQFATLTIVRIAMIEGFGMLGAVALLLTSNWAFIAAPLLAVLIIALLMPSEAKIRVFIARVTGEIPR